MITTVTNLDYLIPAVRMHVGDLTSTAFSDTILRTALVYGMQSLGPRWNNRYFIMLSGMALDDHTLSTPAGTITVDVIPNEYDAFRNTYQTFESEAPPVLEQTDQTPLLLSAAILVRKSALTSTISAFSAWSTPDLSYSNVQSSKAILLLIEEDVKALDRWFSARLATPRKSVFARLGEV